MQAPIAREAIGDARAGRLRFGLTPPTLRDGHGWDAVAALRDMPESEAWRAEKVQARRGVRQTATAAAQPPAMRRPGYGATTPRTGGTTGVGLTAGPGLGRSGAGGMSRTHAL
jgi:hypothetical protein